MINQCDLYCSKLWGKSADLRLSRQQDSDIEASVECQDDDLPLFEDEESAAWASFSLNVVVVHKSLSSVQVRTFQETFVETGLFIS